MCSSFQCLFRNTEEMYYSLTHLNPVVHFQIKIQVQRKNMKLAFVISKLA